MIQNLPKDLLKGWQVVVIDDEPDSLIIAEIILQTYGAEVHTATNGKEGLAQIRAQRPRFVISDISMPQMDGWDVISAIQADLRLKDIPVIALTAHALIGDRERAIAAGFHNYLTKPLNAETFIRDLLVLLVDIPEFAQELENFS